MKEEIKRLIEHLEQTNSKALENFSPPLDSANVKTFVSHHFDSYADIPQSLFELYNWCAGMDSTNFDDDNVKQLYLAYEIYFNSLKDIEAILASDTFYKFKENNLLPVFSTLNGEHIALKLDNKGKLFYCATSDPELDFITSQYDNLESMLRTINSLYDLKYYYLFEDDSIDIDFDKYDDYIKVGKRLNPHSEYWTIKAENM